MALSSSVEKVFRLAEEKSGLTVHVEPDPSLPAATLASVKVAKGTPPLHSVTYQPNASTAPGQSWIQIRVKASSTLVQVWQTNE